MPSFVPVHWYDSKLQRTRKSRSMLYELGLFMVEKMLEDIVENNNILEVPIHKKGRNIGTLALGVVGKGIQDDEPHLQLMYQQKKYKTLGYKLYYSKKLKQELINKSRQGYRYGNLHL